MHACNRASAEPGHLDKDERDSGGEEEQGAKHIQPYSLQDAPYGLYVRIHCFHICRSPPRFRGLHRGVLPRRFFFQYLVKVRCTSLPEGFSSGTVIPVGRCCAWGCGPGAGGRLIGHVYLQLSSHKLSIETAIVSYWSVCCHN